MLRVQCCRRDVPVQYSNATAATGLDAFSICQVESKLQPSESRANAGCNVADSSLALHAVLHGIGLAQRVLAHGCQSQKCNLTWPITAQAAPISMGSPRDVPVPCISSACRLGRSAAVMAARMTSCWEGPFGAVKLLDLPSCSIAAKQSQQASHHNIQMVTAPIPDKHAKETDINGATESLLRGTATLPMLRLHVNCAL